MEKIITEDEFRNLYLNNPHIEVAKQLGVTPNQVIREAKRLGLKKPRGPQPSNGTKLKVIPTEIEIDNTKEAPLSSGFWYDIECGKIMKFIDLVQNENTKQECLAAYNLLSKLEKAIENKVQWR